MKENKKFQRGRVRGKEWEISIARECYKDKVPWRRGITPLGISMGGGGSLSKKFNRGCIKCSVTQQWGPE